MESKDSLKEKIKAWLDEQGYPLEMRIASTPQRKRFRVVQSEYYIDPESGDSRELDVVAHLQKEISGILLRISLLIECKRSTEKPWLLFTSDKVSLANAARIAQRAANSLGKQFLLEVCRQTHLDPQQQEHVHPSYTKVLAQISPVDAKVLLEYRKFVSYAGARGKQYGQVYILQI